MPTFFASPLCVFSASILLRLALLFYGLHQDAHSPLKYTDIDYHVFTSASLSISRGLSPYERETYRYTPLLAWLLLPTTWAPTYLWFSFGKLLFAAGDVLAGLLLVLLLRNGGNGQTMAMEGALKYASIWLLNPMVATISTRGSSEGLLGVMVIALLWAVVRRKITLAGVLLGLSVHFKIYPFIYAPAIMWFLDDSQIAPASNPQDGLQKHGNQNEGSLVTKMLNFFNRARIRITVVSLGTFMGLNALMYILYGFPFLQHTYLHHITRIDHRHNFSPYNTLLYLSSSQPSSSSFNFESLSFIPQLLLSTTILPLLLAKPSLPSTLLAQTFAFVTFNKVCTSQYFLWHTIFLPLYLPNSSFILSPKKGMLASVLWVGSQGLWLGQGYELEFNGKSTFVPGLWGSSLLFFGVNCWILGVIIKDVGAMEKKHKGNVSREVRESVKLGRLWT
ncbi:putative mannosyltransferase [Amylocarpus encephaloides]|uniref:GPI mannosyltransferase 1 n=1 Tax=Amylocarpus encephaloides TaxID=45428 RepID=A0A9P7YQA8_9HELO|nr:putative mannosyltransferase [Amylocarpus encephaloides]